jgi:8-hydroxy-5-deazaflavin:NADPH oxidoreductase
MKIGIIGSGSVGNALGDSWRAKRHDVVYGSRTPQISSDGRRFLPIREAIAASEIVILAVPYPAVNEVLSSQNVSGKIVIDCTNPIASGAKPVPGGFDLAIGFTTSAGEEVAKLAKGACVVKAFNTTGFDNMHDPRYGSTRLTMFYAGDDEAAKEKARQLIGDIGFDPVDAGPLKMARYLEPMALLRINLAMKMGTDIAFQLMQRGR